MGRGTVLEVQRQFIRCLFGKVCLEDSPAKRSVFSLRLVKSKRPRLPKRNKKHGCKRNDWVVRF